MSALTVEATDSPTRHAEVGPTRSGRWLSAAAAALCVALSVAASALFLPHQSLWHDEVVQLSGISLGPVGQVRWLTGRMGDPFGVGLDRSPPLSYWAGWAWSLAFGRGEVAMRWLGVVAVGLATLIVFHGARRAWGLGPGLTAGALLGLSPNVVVAAVEIRAYPLLLLASAASLYCLIRLIAEPDSGAWLAGLAGCGVVAAYTHFFGLVLAGATLLAALILVPTRGGRVRSVALACAAVGLLSLGLAPFVTAAVGLSADEVPGLKEKAVALVRLGYRLVGHPATSVSQAASGLAVLGALSAGAAALTAKRRSQAASVAMLLALGSGAGVVVIAHLAQSRFSAASPSYNLWMLPALSLWLASGLASASRAARRAALAGVVMLLASDAFAAGQLAVNGDFFAHTPYRAVEALIQGYGPGRVAVVADGDGAHAWTFYSPAHYQFAGAVRHYVIDGRVPGTLRVADYPDRKFSVDPLALRADYLIVVRAAPQGAAELAAQVRRGVRPLGGGPVATAARTDSRWSAVSETTYATFVVADVAVFRRVGAD